jgi:hypothetical protein
MGEVAMPQSMKSSELDENPTMTAIREVAMPNDPLVCLDGPERERQLERYFEFLRMRDGEPDHARRQLSNREPFFAEIDRTPVMWQGDVGAATFQAYLEKAPPEQTDPRVIWLLAAAKANRAERYAIDIQLEKYDRSASDGNRWTEFIELEEFYHSRILADACLACSLENPKIDPPPMHRAFIHVVTSLPEVLRMPLVLAGEIFGCVGFQVMYENAHLFDAQPAVAARLRRLTQEILIDEMGHVAYCRSRVGRFGLFVARRLLPIVSITLLHDMPEFAMLAGGKAALMDRVRNFEFARLGRSTAHA